MCSVLLIRQNKTIVCNNVNLTYKTVCHTWKNPMTFSAEGDRGRVRVKWRQQRSRSIWQTWQPNYRSQLQVNFDKTPMLIYSKNPIVIKPNGWKKRPNKLCVHGANDFIYFIGGLTMWEIVSRFYIVYDAMDDVISVREERAHTRYLLVFSFIGANVLRQEFVSFFF